MDGLIDVTETIRQRRWWHGSYPLGGVTGGRRQGRPGAVFGTPALTRINVPAVANVGTVMRLRLVTNAPGSIRRFGTTQVRRNVTVEREHETVGEVVGVSHRTSSRTTDAHGRKGIGTNLKRQ